MVRLEEVEDEEFVQSQGKTDFVEDDDADFTDTGMLSLFLFQTSNPADEGRLF